MGLLDIPEAAAIKLIVTLHGNGALSVEGPVHDKKFCLALLDHAKDAVRNHGKPGLVVPAKDVQLPEKVPYVS